MQFAEDRIQATPLRLRLREMRFEI